VHFVLVLWWRVLISKSHEYSQEQERTTQSSCNGVAKELLATMFGDVQDNSTDHSLQSKNGSETQNELSRTKWHVPKVLL
jgi:hypothetical protein